MKSLYPPHIYTHDQIILFDGTCKLCNRWSKFIIRFDKRHVFKLCPVQSKDGQEILQWFGLPTDYFETMLLVQGNKALFKSDAFIEIIKQLPFPWHIARIINILPKSLRDWLYNRIALNRYKLFGKYDSCILPTADHLHRFLKSKTK